MRVLVVDDSHAMRALISRSLRDVLGAGAAVGEAHDGHEALVAIRASAPDLVLANWNMPGISGIELLETLRREGISARFGFVTSDQSSQNRTRADAAGASFLLAKPFTRGELERAVVGALKQARLGKGDRAILIEAQESKTP